MLKCMLFKRTFAIVATGCLMVSSLHAQQAAAPAKVVKVEKNAYLEGALMQPLDPATARPGDSVPLRLTQPLTAGGVVVLPVGSVVHGRITKVTPAGPRCTRGSVKWKLDQVQLPDGSNLKTELGNANRSARQGGSQHHDYTPGEIVGYVIQDAVLLPLVLPGLAIYEVRKTLTAPFRHGSCSRWKDLPLPANTVVGLKVREDHEVRLP